MNDLAAEGITNPTKEDIDRRLYTFPCPSPDVILRTGGDHRLSEFLTWQITSPSSSSIPPFIAFSDAFWPDFGLLDFLLVVFRFQIHRSKCLLTRSQVRSPPLNPNPETASISVASSAADLSFSGRSSPFMNESTGIPSGQMTPISLTDSSKASLIELDRLLKTFVAA